MRPALAGEGRYFVRVPRGTNADDYTVEAPQRMSADALDITAGADDGLDGFTRAQLFLQFREAQETEGFKGEFGGKKIHSDGL